MLAVALILANYLASSIPLRLDLTADNLYTLSPGTKALLSKINEPIRLDFYFSRDVAGLPIQYKNYAGRVEEMLRQYARAARGRLLLNLVHPKPDTVEEERAATAGLQPFLLPNGDQVFFGLVAIQADQQKSIANFAPDPGRPFAREPFLEYDISQLIHQVQQFDRPRLGLLTSLPLRPEMDFMAMQQGRMPQSQFVIAELEKNFEIVSIEPSAESLPENLATLAILHPQNVSQKLQFAIDRFLLSGKPVFIAVDPSSHHFKGRSQRMAMMGGPPPNASSNLPELFQAWGIDYQADQVVGDLESQLSARTAAGGSERMPIWLALSGDALNDQALPTSRLNSIWLFEAGNFTLRESAGLTLTPLLQSSARSGTIASMMLGFAQPEGIARQIEPTGRKTLAALIQGKFKSAFPDGPPPEEKKEAGAQNGEDTGQGPESGEATPEAGSAENKDDAAAPERAAADPLKESAATSALVLIADTDWLLDDYSVRRINFMGVQAAEPLNDNLAFMSNALEFLSGSQDLIAIRGKGTSMRPFTVVNEMETKAQLKYQEQLDALEARLNEVQNKLTELQGQKTEEGRLVATPEAAEAIEDFRLQQVQLRAERRKIRKSLREDIEALENGLLFFNLLTSPLLVGAFGWWFHVSRRRKG